MVKLISIKGDAAAWRLVEPTHAAGAGRPQSLLSSLVAAPRRVAAALAKELAARRAMRSLASLDDRLLRDIGLDRGQIDHAVRQGRQAAKEAVEAKSHLMGWF